MFVKKLHPHIYDVFIGKGWDNWSRVKRSHFGLHVVAGRKLNRNVLRELEGNLK